MARDTAEDWQALGEIEPWYGVLSAPQFLKANITDETKDAFYAQGREEIAWAVEQIRTSALSFSPAKALDFGSGLGRLAFAMSDYCESVIGIDISPGMVAEANNQKSLRGFDRVEFAQHIPDEHLYDWINSYIVLQHIVPRTGYQIIKRLLSALAPGGWTSIQLTFAHDQRDLTSLQRDAYAYRYDGETATVLDFKDTAVGEMSMYDYDLNQVLFTFVRSGISNIKLAHTDHGGVHGFWIFGQKA